MLDQANSRTIVASLQLPLGSYAIVSGMLMAEHGLRHNYSDIDLLVTPLLYEELLTTWKVANKGSTKPHKTPTKAVCGIRIEAFASINFQDSIKAVEYIARAELHNGLPFIRLADMLEWKESYAFNLPDDKAERHIRDIELMRKALGVVAPNLFSWDFSWK
jgi:hypothetical protein